MHIQINEHFSYGKLVRFVIPSVIMMIFTSVYGVVDGLFVSNYAGKTSFAAVNLIMPFLMVLGTIGFMIGTGGNAIIAKKLGEGEKKTANEYFSMLVYSAMAIGIVLTIAGQIFLEKIAVMLGADGNMLTDCVAYGRIILFSLVGFILQNVFQNFLLTANKSQIGLAVTIAAGVANILLDFIFVGVMKMGITGAAYATAISQTIGGIFPLIYFILPNSSFLRLGKAKFQLSVFIQTCANGASELMTNVSMSLVNMLYNYQLMKFAGEDGVAVYGVIMYVAFISVSICIGYSIGTAPITAFNYGAENHAELKNIFRKSLVIISVSSIIIFLISELSAPFLSTVFVGYDKSLQQMTKHAFRIYSISFLVSGFNIYSSSFFTALGNGAVSAIISFARTLLFQVVSVLVLPMIFDINGIWGSIIAAEILSLAVSIYFLVSKRKRYNY